MTDLDLDSAPVGKFPRESRMTLRSLLAAALMATAACRTTKTIAGRVYDFESARPLSHVPVRAVQRGWGVSTGGVVWDREYVSTDTTDANGAFRLRFRVGGSANVIVAVPGYNEFRHGYEPATGIRIRLNALAPEAKPLPTGFPRLGQYVDGRTSPRVHITSTTPPRPRRSRIHWWTTTST